MLMKKFVFTTSHGLHVPTVSKVKTSMVSSIDFRSAFRKAVESSFSVVRSLKNDRVRVHDLGDKGSGIIDTGASKTVIGEKRVHEPAVHLATTASKACSLA